MNDKRKPQAEPELMDREVGEIPDVGAMVAITRAEIDGQIATAHAFPRSLTEFKRESVEMVTLDEDSAQACIYALPRKDQNGRDITIAGPSVRFAEIIFHAFGNSVSGGRVVCEDGNFIVAQGVFHDLQRNTKTTMEVRRRIVDRFGKKFKADMIGVTGNAAAAIAQRNAILKGIPKALWLPVYEAARMCAVGDVTTLADRRTKALGQFQAVGVPPDKVCRRLGVEGVDDIGLAELEILTGFRTAIREGARPEEVFAEQESEDSTVKAPTHVESMGDVAAAVKAKNKGKKPDNVMTNAEFHDNTGAVARGASTLALAIAEAGDLTTLAELQLEIEAVPDDADRASLLELLNSYVAKFAGEEQ